jgi:HPt (histidine-containing phosphotransfer) domain-containing protein
MNSNIPGLNTEKGIAMTGVTEEGYFLVLSAFYNDAQERLKNIDKSLKEGALSEFVVHVHAIKSASAAIGAEELSAEARSLEMAGKNGDTAYIDENLSAFLKHLEEQLMHINDAFERNQIDIHADIDI